MASEEEPNIVVREVRGEKKVGFRGMQYVDKPESEMRELVQDQGEAIIAFYEADENLEGVDKYWRFGEIIAEHTNGDVTSSDLQELLKYSTLDIVQSYDLKLWNNFYEMFPDGGYDPEYPWAMYRDMVVDKRLAESKEVFKRLQNQLDDDIPRTYEYRAFLNCDTYGLIQIVSALYDLGESQTSTLTLSKLTEGARRVRIMADEDPAVATENNIKNAVEAIEIVNGLDEEDGQ